MDGRPVTISKQEALIKTAYAKGLKGDIKAIAIIFSMLKAGMQTDKELNTSPSMSSTDNEIVERFLRRHLTRKKGNTK